LLLIAPEKQHHPFPIRLVTAATAKVNAIKEVEAVGKVWLIPQLQPQNSIPNLQLALIDTVV